MREIEFRAKGLFKDRWYYGYFVDCKRNMRCQIVNLDEEKCDLAHYVRKDTVGQYIGLKDKNGNKIFEGDIVRDDYGIYQILFDRYGWDSGAGLTGFIGIHSWEKPDIEGWYEANRCIDDNELEIIGNIYDNPELLEGD